MSLSFRRAYPAPSCLIETNCQRPAVAHSMIYREREAAGAMPGTAGGGSRGSNEGSFMPCKRDGGSGSSSELVDTAQRHGAIRGARPGCGDHRGPAIERGLGGQHPDCRVYAPGSDSSHP